ncbi:MAG: 2'-deoxycytidine 5'-triphosphate deaminase [Alphaproteobacteria bacterium]|nr:2'-deoxycytidine 5'-triphosphate deaminase [Alphaproteobacteria bacterium]
MAAASRPDASPAGAARDDARHYTGLLPSQTIRELIRAGEIAAAVPIADDQVQPASLDLRLGTTAYRVQASFLPGRNATVAAKIHAFEMHQIDLTAGAVLERGCVYIVPLLESVRLGPAIGATANPKSSTGRLDVFTRVITDQATQFDVVRRGYEGPLYAEISPSTFSVAVRAGSRLNQLRLRRGTAGAAGDQLLRLHDRAPLVDVALDRQEVRDHASLALHLDLEGVPGAGIVGFRAKRHAAVVDIDRVGHYDPAAFWEPIAAPAPRGIILNPGDFTILATREAVTVPPDHAAEMVAYDTLVGEFRVHYAGFFDPGFGHAESGGAGSRAVLEVRSHEVPFLLEHGQLIGRLRYERLTDVPDRLYGRGIGSSYQGQGLALGKQFRRGAA